MICTAYDDVRFTDLALAKNRLYEIHTIVRQFDRQDEVIAF